MTKGDQESVFGILRPCRHRLPGDLATTWMAHLCGMCLALRDDHGHLARTVTNYDGLLISALVEAQTPVSDRRTAGPCALRGMRSTPVAQGAGARLAASVSLVLASAKVRDHVDDGDGVFGRAPVSGAARLVATRWARQGTRTGDSIGFSTAVLLDAVGRQAEVESAVGLGASALLATEPTETATAAAFAHTAHLAGLPANAEPLAEAGRLFGRVAHLLDAVEDYDDDRATGAWNPLSATGTTLAEARRLCDDAVMGVRYALNEVTFHDGALVHALLVHELGSAVERAFRPHGLHTEHVEGCRLHSNYPPGGQPPYRPHPGHPGQPGYPGRPVQPPHPGQQGHPGHPQQGQVPRWQGHGGPEYRPVPPGAPGPQGPTDPPKHGKRPRDPYQPSRCFCWRWPKLLPQPKSRGVLLGCFACLYECGSCQVCCRDPYPGSWSGKPKDAWCDNCDCGDCGNCDCCCPCDC